MTEDRLQEIREGIDSYVDNFKTMAENLNELQGYVSECNLKLNDLDHFLELESLEPHQMANLTLRRKVILMERRKAKDFLSIIENIVPKQTEGRTTRDRYDIAIRNLSNRVYTPRVIELDDAVRSLS